MFKINISFKSSGCGLYLAALHSPEVTVLCTATPLTFVPGLPVLAPSSDVGNGQDSTQMSDEDEAGDAVARSDGYVESSVAVEEAWVGAVQCDSLLVNNKHGDLSAVFGRIEDLEGTETH